MFDRLRSAWLVLTAPEGAEHDEEKCPNCGSETLLDVTTVDMPLDRKQYLCGDCNHSWQQEAQE